MHDLNGNTDMLATILLWGQNQPQAPSFMPLIMIGGMFLLFYLIMIRPAQRQEKERKLLAANLEKNDRIVTSAGIYGTVVSVNDEADEVIVRVDENVKLKMMRAAVLRNITKEEAFEEAKKASAS